MREIKFRAYDEETNRMVFWTLNDLLVRFGEEKYSDEKKDCSPFFNWHEYTGLKDKNGKEIYFGDIVRDYLKRILIVGIGGYWETKGGCGNGVFYYAEDEGFLFSATPFEQDNAVEIIGNIYENKELLK